MNDQTLRNVGKIITDEQQRDAVHMAVLPVSASAALRPGQHVWVFKGAAYPDDGIAQSVGIVDPFLRRPVMQGQKFLVWLYPNSITSLRHDWTHPTIDAKVTP